MDNIDQNVQNKPRIHPTRDAFRKLRTRIKWLENRLKEKCELAEHLKEENMALRENNIRFQVENYRLHTALKRHQRRNKLFDNFRNMNFDDRGEDSDNEYFEFVKEDAGNEYNSENEAFEDGMSYNSNLEDDYFEEPFDETLDEEDDKDIPMEIPEKYPAADHHHYQQHADTTEKMERSSLQLPNKIPITKSQVKYLENLKEGKKYDGFFVCKLMDIFFERDSLLSASNSTAKNEFKQKMAFQQLDPVRIKMMRKMLASRIETELADKIQHLDFDDEKRERLKKFYGYINIKLHNLKTAKKQPAFRRSVSESGTTGYL